MTLTPEELRQLASDVDDCAQEDAQFRSDKCQERANRLLAGATYLRACADAEPVGAESQTRYRAVQQGFWWRVQIGNGTQTVLKFHTKNAAEEVCAQLLRAFLDGHFVGSRPDETAALRGENERLREANDLRTDAARCDVLVVKEKNEDEQT